MTKYPYEIKLDLDKLHKKNIQPLVKNFKLIRLFKGHEIYAANLKSIIKYKKLTTDYEKTIIKIYDSDMPPYDRLQYNYLEEYSDFGKNGPETFSYKEIDDAFQNAGEQLKTTFEMFDNALLSSKLEMSLLCFVVALEGLFIIKN